MVVVAYMVMTTLSFLSQPSLVVRFILKISQMSTWPSCQSNTHSHNVHLFHCYIHEMIYIKIETMLAYDS